MRILEEGYFLVGETEQFIYLVYLLMCACFATKSLFVIRTVSKFCESLKCNLTTLFAFVIRLFSLMYIIYRPGQSEIQNVYILYSIESIRVYFTFYILLLPKVTQTVTFTHNHRFKKMYVKYKFSSCRFMDIFS